MARSMNPQDISHENGHDFDACVSAGSGRGGIELDRFYTFQFCSPARSAIQTGRNPIHVAWQFGMELGAEGWGLEVVNGG